MSCCGGKRAQYRPNVGMHQRSEPSSEALRAPVAPITEVFFEYTGSTGLTVVGPITGKRYRFNRPGAVVGVDSRDSSSLVAVPHLARRRGGEGE